MMSVHTLAIAVASLLWVAGGVLSNPGYAEPLPSPGTASGTTLSGSTSLSVQGLPNRPAIEYKPTSPQMQATDPCAQALERATTLLQQGQIAPALMSYQTALDRAESRSDYFAVVHTLTAMGAYRLADVAGQAMATRFPELGAVWQSWRKASFPANLPSAHEELITLRQTYQDHQPPLAPSSAPSSAMISAQPLPSSAGLQRLTRQFEQRQFRAVISALSQPSPEGQTPMGQWLLSRTRWQQNQPNLAQNALNHALTLAGGTFSHTQQRAFYRHIIDTLLAENWLSPAAQLLTLHPDLYTATEPQPYELTGRIALATGKPTEGQGLLWQAAFLDAHQPRVWVALAQTSQRQAGPDRAQLVAQARQSARYSDQADGVRLVEEAGSALTDGPPPREATLNEQSYLRYLLTAEASYQQVMATFYRALPAQLAQPDVEARQRFVREAFGSVKTRLTAMASGNPPASPGCLATRQALLAKAYEQLGILQQLAAEPDLSAQSLTRLHPALRQQAQLETALIADLPRLTSLPPMTFYEIKQAVGLTFDREQQTARTMAALATPPEKGSTATAKQARTADALLPASAGRRGMSQIAVPIRVSGQ